MDDKNKPSDSPWQDAKDAKAAINTAAKKIDDFATHSTSRVIGPLVTKTLKGVERWWHSTTPPLVKKPVPKSPSLLEKVFVWFGSSRETSQSNGANPDLSSTMIDSPVDSFDPPDADFGDWV